MPNKYSHAFVLSRYETKGFISLQPRPLTPPTASFSPSDFDLYARNGSDGTCAPSLDAVPALSDTSTTSTASSNGEPAQQPSHSASSSIVTEIYAPQVDTVESTTTAYIPPEDKPQEALPAIPSPIREPSPPPPKSRFSSFHDLYPFISRHSSPAQRSKKSSRRDSNRSHSKGSKPTETPASTTPRPRSHTTHQPHQSTPLQHPQPYHHSLYRKRLEPTFDNDSLASLSLSDLYPDIDDGRKSPNMDVLPWEYPETHPTSPPVYQPSGSPPYPQFQIRTPPIPPANASQKSVSETKTHNQTSISLPAAPSIHYNSANQPIKYFPSSRPKRHSSISSPRPHHSSNSSSQAPAQPHPHAHPPQPTSPAPCSIPQSMFQQTLSHNLSTESFDSAAPPPIRTTPRAGSRRMSVEGEGLSMIGDMKVGGRREGRGGEIVMGGLIC
ncbi:MAG: hypothetical protein Q9204_002687 [Flavoplaca sp. TL-2023a]